MGSEMCIRDRYRYGACERLGVRWGGKVTVSGPPSREASDLEVGRRGAGPASRLLRWAKIAPQEAGRSPPPPSSKLSELARVALSWDVPGGGVLGTEPLGEAAVGSFGSERLSPEALDQESPDTTMGGSEIPRGGPISAERGPRLGEASAIGSRRPWGSPRDPEEGMSSGIRARVSAMVAGGRVEANQELGPEAVGRGSLPVWHRPERAESLGGWSSHSHPGEGESLSLIHI